ncbi:dlt, partial [Drosophila busckii]
EPEQQQLQQLLTQLEQVPLSQLPDRFQAYFEQQTSDSSLEDFAVYYLAALRQHTELYFRSGASSEAETPKCQTPVRQAKPPTAAVTQLEFNESLLSQLSLSNASESTPVRGHSGRCSTPQSGNERTTNRSGGGANGSGSFCLGDFLATPNHSQRSKKRVTPQQISTPKDNNQSQKPRRRVLPMTISRNVSSTSFGDTSSFSNENNLWRISQSSDMLDRSQVAAFEQEARKTLLLHKQHIKNEAASNYSMPQQAEREPESEPEEETPLTTTDMEQIESGKQQQLQRLAGIYSQLIDLNLVPNVLSELSYTLQLLNTRVPVENADQQQQLKDTAFSLLIEHKQCIYFALQLLEQEQHLLLQLDRKSLTVLLQHKRICLLPTALQQQLEASCQRKQQQLNLESDNNTGKPTAAQQNVYYQPEKDSRENFPTQNEFGAFKTQRDLFYKALKQWELSHLNRIFCFAGELSARVRDIFKQSEHVVNMAHFAQLFVSQLLMCSAETPDTAEDLGLKLDQQRLNRLAQRLVTSNSSVEDQFPRSQAFFRDFIAECNSVAFLAQLQLALYAQLQRLNDSSFELQQLAASDDLAEEVQQQQATQQTLSPCIVRSQTLAELLLLAKFLGYVYALPFSRGSAFVCPQQLQLRRQCQPPYELRPHLERAMREGKLLITLPWLVQYLGMLDAVTLQLPACLQTLQLLYALYAATAQLQGGAIFLIRSCLGWLLDTQSTLGSGYYSYRRQNHVDENTTNLISNCLQSFSLLPTQLPQLESLLPVACPFLHEFRVAITPTQRQPARSGRYRYITTRLEQLQPVVVRSTPLEPSATPAQQQQRQLVDAFLHSQHASMRRLLEFVSERSFKCVVKDAQQQLLLPSKAAADALVNGISSTHQQEVQREVQRIYEQARSQLCQLWQQQVPGMLDERIEQSLLALLPVNTNAVVRATYAQLIRAQASQQLQQWLQTSVLQTNFYHGDLPELAAKICRVNKTNAQSSEATTPTQSNELCLIAMGSLSLSQLLHELQQWLHCLSLRPYFLCHLVPLPLLLERSKLAALQSQLPSYFYQLLGSCLIRLLQLLMCRQPQKFNLIYVNLCCDVWLSPQLRHNRDTFETLLSLNFVQELSHNLQNVELLKQLLLVMLTRQLLQLDKLNQLFMPLFKHNWPHAVWQALSQLLSQLSQHQAPQQAAAAAEEEEEEEDPAKSQLFMEVLADLSRDLDSF